MENTEKDIETIYNELQELLANADDDMKLRVYDELLQTGSVTLTNETEQAHIFAISELKHIEPSVDDVIENDIYITSDDEITEIDIDIEMLDLEVHEIIDEPDYEEMNDDELLAAGINPDTKNPMTPEFIFNKVDDLIDNSKSFYWPKKGLTEENKIWIEDIYALKYIKAILEYHFNYARKKAIENSDHKVVNDNE